MDTNQHEKIEAYLSGQLSPAATEEFEEAYLADSALLDELLLAESLKRGLADHAERAGPRASRPRGLWLAPRYAAAAAVVLAVSVIASGLLYLDNRALRDGTMPVMSGAATRLVPLVAVRGQSEAELGPFAADEWTVLLADPGFGGFDIFDAAVVRESNDGAETVWESRGLAPSYEGLLAIGLPGARLTAGEYRLELRGRGADWPAGRASEDAGRFSFRVAPRP